MKVQEKSLLVWFKETEYAALKDQAEKRDLSMSQLVRLAVRKEIIG